MAKKQAKTNAMRILDRMHIPYEHHEYEMPEEKSRNELGMQIADLLGLPRERVFKTLVTEGNDREYYVFVVPVADNLDLKKCARSVGVKSVAMIHTADIMKVTGYIRGGTTAIGMKKPYTVRISEKAKPLPTMIISGGRPGSQLELAPDDLVRAANAAYADLSAE